MTVGGLLWHWQMGATNGTESATGNNPFSVTAGRVNLLRRRHRRQRKEEALAEPVEHLHLAQTSGH
jgi:hypothetical protein